MHARSSIALILLLLALACPVSADEDATPASRYAAAVKALPAPSQRRALSFRGPVFREGREVGAFEAVAEVVPSAKTEGEASWRLRFAYNLGPDTYAAEALVTRTLQPVRGKVTTTTDGEDAAWTWTREGKAIRVVHTSGSTRPMTRAADAVEPALTTVTAILLFARLAPDATTAYATRRFDPTWNVLLGQQPYVDAPIRITAPAKPGSPLQVEAGFGTRTLEAELDRLRRLPRWLKLTPRKGPALQFGGTATPATDGIPDDDVFTRPAKTPQAAGLRAAYAFATADRAVLDDLMHWPGLRKRMGAKVPTRVSAEAFRKGMLGQLIATVREPRKPDTVKPVLRDVAGQLTTTERDGGVVRVTFPERFVTRWYDVVEVEGAWRLVGWPGS